MSGDLSGKEGSKEKKPPGPAARRRKAEEKEAEGSSQTEEQNAKNAPEAGNTHTDTVLARCAGKRLWLKIPQVLGESGISPKHASRNSSENPSLRIPRKFGDFPNYWPPRFAQNPTNSYENLH